MRITRELSTLWGAAVRYYKAPGEWTLMQLKTAALEFGASEDLKRSAWARNRERKRRERREQERAGIYMRGKRTNNVTVRMADRELELLTKAARSMSDRLGVRVGVGTVMRLGGLERARNELESRIVPLPPEEEKEAAK